MLPCHVRKQPNSLDPYISKGGVIPESTFNLVPSSNNKLKILSEIGSPLYTVRTKAQSEESERERKYHFAKALKR
jgi:hypothetical protein